MTQTDRVLNIRAKIFKNNSCACVKNTTNNYHLMQGLFFYSHREKLLIQEIIHAHKYSVSVSV